MIATPGDAMARTAVRHLLRAADRPVIPYLGQPEDHFFAAFVNAFANVRARIRTTQWAGHLESCTNPDEAMALVRLTVRSATQAFAEGVVPVYAQASMLGGRSEGIVAVSVVRKGAVGKGAVRKAGPEPAPKINLTSENVVPFLEHPSNVAVSSAYHITAAQNMAMDLITHITNQQEDAIRQIVTESFTHGIDALKTGDRIANVVGLFPRWQRAVDRFHARQIDEGVRADIASKRANRYADKLLRKRGRMIARTELMRAMNLGRLTQWRWMADEERLDPDRSVKVWVAAPGACPVCAAMNGKRVEGINEFFETELGDFDHPPIHPHCRCTMNLIAIPGERGLSGRNQPDMDDEDEEALDAQEASE